MAKWEAKHVCDVVRMMQEGKLVLPVIQRELVWTKDKIVALFQTLLMQDSFGGIMTVRDPRKDDREPLFEYRKFENNYVTGNEYFSKKFQFSGEDIVYVIDGQQRLSAFFIGLTGSYDYEDLFFDILGNNDQNEFDFAFAKSIDTLPIETHDSLSDEPRRTLWISVRTLFDWIKDGRDVFGIRDEIFEANEWMSEKQKDSISKNINAFQSVIFIHTCVGLSEVTVNMRKPPVFNRLRIVRLFQKLNQGGTILSGIELMRSVLKAYDAAHEPFLAEVGKKYNDLDMDQDTIMRLVFLLQDEPQKDIDAITEADSKFISNNKERIFACLDATRKFLERIGYIDYFYRSHPSTVPLTLIAYHFFHKNIKSVEGLLEYSASDIQSRDFHLMRLWLLMSLLHHVFQRGNGWNPNTTGRKKIFEILRDNKGKDFPANEIFELYQNHPLHNFNPNLVNDEPHISWYERSLVIYIMYGKGKDVLFRQNDVDHIHPRNILEQIGVQPDLINSICNFQWLFYRDNRSKQDVEFGTWLLEKAGFSDSERADFLRKHLIPVQQEYWYSNNFKGFLDKRRDLIYRCLCNEISL